MPTLPGIDVQARSARSSASPWSTNVNPDAFGAGVGRAVSGLGNTAVQLGAQISQVGERQRQEKLANAVAQADFTPYEVQARQEVGADGSGYRDNVLGKYEEFVDQEANKIEDDWTRMQFRQKMEADKPNISSRAALYEEQQGTIASKNAADASLMALENKVISDPSQYAKYKSEGLAVLAARPGMNATQIQAMQVAFTQNIARARFTGMLEDAKTPEDLDNIMAELDDPKAGWQTEFNPTDYNWVRNAVDSTRVSFRTLADTNARAAIDTLTERNSALTKIDDQELRDVAQVVRQSKDPIVTARFARIARDQQFIRVYKGSSSEELRYAIDKSGGAVYPDLSPDLSTAVNETTQRFDVSAGFLGGLIHRESNGNPSAKADGSSASGLTQFTDSTFLDLMKSGTTAQRMGVDIAGKSDEQILAMRFDPKIATMAAAAYAEKNRYYLESTLKRPVSDAELYMAHFLGPQGAETLLRAMVTNPSGSAAALLPKAAEKNLSVFYAHGRAKTVAGVYNSIATDFSANPSQVAYGDVKVLSDMQDATEKGLKADPMLFAKQSGRFDIQDLTDAASYVARADVVRSAAQYYNIPVSDMKPFTADEANRIAMALDTSDSDQALAVLANIQQLGGPVAQAAFKQLDQKDKVWSYAAGLASEGGNASAATDVIRGRKRLEDNPSLKESIGTPSDVSNMFNKLTGPALLGVAPDQRQAIQDAATAHYAETYLSRGKSGMDEGAYQASINAVLGGSAESKAIGIVNGAPTVLPVGVSENDMQKAIDNMTIDDWIRLSPQKTPPMFLNGEVASADTMANEARLQAIGGGQYRILFDDNTYAITGVVAPSGRLEAYVFQPTAKDVQAINGAREQEINKGMLDYMGMK